MSLIVVIKGPVASAGSILYFCNDKGINVPNNAAKIITVKSTSKYASAEKCMTYASSRKSMKAYTYNSSSKKCYVYASVRSVKPDEDSVSGLLSDN